MSLSLDDHVHWIGKIGPKEEDWHGIDMDRRGEQL